MSAHSRRDRGFTMPEVIAAFAVLSVAAAVMFELVASTRKVTRANAESRLAECIAQGALERARHLSPEELGGQGPVELPLPDAAERLAEAKLTVTVREWRSRPGLRHVRVRLTWRSRLDREREIVRETLVSDNQIP